MGILLRYDHYKVLGVDRDASPQRIRKAFRERVMQCHPDRDPRPQAAALFQAVHEAYTVLRDADQRRQYDERLRHYRPASACPGNGGTSAKRSHPFRSAVHERPPSRLDRLAFRGLHWAGLAFGCMLVIGILIGSTFLGWPAYTLVFCLPGLAVLPDSMAGLRH